MARGLGEDGLVSFNLRAGVGVPQNASKRSEDAKIGRTGARSCEQSFSFSGGPVYPARAERMSTESPLAHESVLRTVGAVADRLGIEAYAVGGAVRDGFLDRPTTDLDFVSIGSGSGIKLAEAVAEEMGGRSVHVYERFGTAAIRLPEAEGGLVLEFVGARKESYRKDSRKPIVEDGTLEEDQSPPRLHDQRARHRSQRRALRERARPVRRRDRPRRQEAPHAARPARDVRGRPAADAPRRPLRRTARLQRRHRGAPGDAGEGAPHRDRQPGADHRRAAEDRRCAAPVHRVQDPPQRRACSR